MSRNVIIEDKTAGTEYYNEFNEVYPFKDIKRVIIDSATGNILHFCSEESSFYDQNGNPTNYDKNTQEIFTYFPPFYYKRTWENNKHYDSILDLTPGEMNKNIDGYEVHPAFVRPDGSIRPYVLVACFMGERSITNGNFESDINMKDFRNKIRNSWGRNNDKRFNIMTIQCHSMLITLLWMLLQNRKIREILGGGAYNTRYSEEDEMNMGHRIGNYINSYNQKRSSFYGITRYWQSTTHAIDGVIIKNRNQLYICEDYDKVDDYNTYTFVEELPTDMVGKTWYTFGELYELDNRKFNWFNFPKNQTNGIYPTDNGIQDTEDIQVLKTSRRSLEGRGDILNIIFNTSHRDNITGSSYQTNSFVCFLP